MRRAHVLIASLTFAGGLGLFVQPASADGAWPPQPPPPKVTPHIVCWEMGGFCWTPWVW